MGEPRPTREGYVEGLLEAGRLSARVVLVEGDVSRSIGSHVFAEEFPDRFLNLGASEQDMMAEAAGLALAGMVPFVSTYAVFVTGRAWDQVRTSVCHMNLDVRIGGAHGGVSVGPDGATHQALEDTALMRVLPGMKVLVPADAEQTKAAVLASLEASGPVYIRFGRNRVPQVYPSGSRVELGRANLLREGSDVLLVACGVMVSASLEAADLLAGEGISASVVDSVSVSPLDHELLLSQAGRVGRVVVSEDHQLAGGLYGAVAELLGEELPLPMAAVAVRGRFGESGTPERVREACGLTARDVADAARRLLGRGGSH